MGQTAKIAWSGALQSIQPRIRLMRSFDERSHSYLGYNLQIQGSLGGEEGQFVVAIGKAAQGTYAFRIGDQIAGHSTPVADPRLEIGSHYKTTGLALLGRPQLPPQNPPPWHAPPPALEVYRARGHRRLAKRTYDIQCRTCIWGCHMPVEMIVDPWIPTFRYRTETFCYGPLSCPFYAAGPTRKVPGRKGMVWEEEDWVDEEATSHRSADE